LVLSGAREIEKRKKMKGKGKTENMRENAKERTWKMGKKMEKGKKYLEIEKDIKLNIMYC
jgi:hypothetical protein